MPRQVSLKRDCEAVQIPDGTPVILPVGTEGRLTQALGTSFTVLTPYGRMYRIDGKDAAAAGLDPADFAAPAGSSQGSLEERLWDLLRTCYDPEIPVNIVDLGLIYDLSITPLAEGGNAVGIKMTLTAPGCGMGEILAQEVRQKIAAEVDVARTEVEIVFDPQWNQMMMSEAARLHLGFF